MSSRAAHVTAGGLCAVSFYLSLVEVPANPAELIMLYGVGYFGGRIPDLLEPATNPNHRRFFHCVLVLLLIAYGIKLLMDWKPKDNAERILKGVLIATGIGYLSHLALDGMTPKSLPLLG